jgi:RNA polymerase sigma-70 factor (ECF subfamily)
VTKSSASRQYLGVSESNRQPPVADTFDTIYERELTYVWKTLGRLGVAPSDLADGVHDVFVVVYRKWDEIDHERPIRPWLFGIARRLVATTRRKRREILSDDLDRAAPVDDRAAQRDLLWLALATLDEDRRDVVILHDLDGFTGLEIAEILEIPANTVHSRLRLARVDLAAAVARLRGSR